VQAMRHDSAALCRRGNNSQRRYVIAREELMRWLRQHALGPIGIGLALIGLWLEFRK